MGLREEIISNLRTFSELSKKYGIKSIYRSKEADFFRTKVKPLRVFLDRDQVTDPNTLSMTQI